MVTKADFPKTARYRGKTYAIVDVFKTKKVAEKFAKKRTGINKVGHFFSFIKKFHSGYSGKDFYVVYWRAVYKKSALKAHRGQKFW